MSNFDTSSLLFSESHEWIAISENVAKIGITDHAQEELGDIVFVELIDVGTEVAAGDSFGSIESVKAVSELIAPFSGTIKSINQPVIDAPETINTDPYTAGWMVEIEFSSSDDLKSLMDEKTYNSFIES